MENKYLEAYKKQNLRACQLKQVKILDEIVRICEKHNIDYWLDSGTLLGAIRHGGFIPWDDDIDIGMTEEGLKRFIDIAPSELPESMRLFNPFVGQSRRYANSIVKVRDLNSVFVEFGDDFKADYDKGLYVDIFPFVKAPSIPKELMRFVCRGFSKSRAILLTQHYYSVRAIAEFFYFGLKFIFCWLLWKILLVIRPTDKYLTAALFCNGFGNRHTRDTIFPLATTIFEGKQYRCPANSDLYLKDLFGDYMKLPPENQRVAHSFFLKDTLIEKEDSAMEFCGAASNDFPTFDEIRSSRTSNTNPEL